MPAITDFLESLRRRGRPPANGNTEAENAQKRAIGVRNIFWQSWDLLDLQYVENPWYDIMDIFVDDGALFLIVNSDGRLYRHTVEIENDIVSVSEGIEVMQSFTPLARQMTVTRQDDGRVRVTQIVASSVLNRNSQIDSTELFDNFVRRAEETGEYPVIDFLHYNAVRLGQADFLARAGFTYIASWLFDDSDVGRAAGESFLNDSEDYWGASIQFTPLEAQMVTIAEDVEVLTFVDGINTFISVLPESCAANLFTARKVEVKQMNDKDFERLVKLLGGNVELARQVSEMATKVNGEIADGKMIARQSGEDGETAATEGTPETGSDDDAGETPAATDTAGFDIDDELVVEIAGAIVASDEFRTALSEMIPELPELPEEMVSRSALDEVVGSIEALREAIVGRLDVLEAMNVAAAAQWNADRPRNGRGAPQSPNTGRRQLRYRPRTERDPDNAGAGNPADTDDPGEYITQIADSRPSFASY